MTTRALLRFVMAAAAAGTTVHLLVSLAAASALHRLYPHRIFNVRTWSEDAHERAAAVGSFLVERARLDRRPLVAFIGSSVAYGYPWNEQFIASQRFAERHREYTVINASVLGADVGGIHDLVLCAAGTNGIRFDIAVIEIPVVNTTSFMADSQRAGRSSRRVESCGSAAPSPSYRRLALTSPRGLGWLRVLWNSDSNQTEDSVSIGEVPPGYFVSKTDFAAIRRVYSQDVAALLRDAQRVAGRVYAFPSPVYVGGLAEAGQDARAVQQQLDATVEACGLVPGVTCVDTSALEMERANFYNFTHLNQSGHRELAQLIAGAMIPVGERPTARH